MEFYGIVLNCILNGPVLSCVFQNVKVSQETQSHPGWGYPAYKDIVIHLSSITLFSQQGTLSCNPTRVY